MTTRPDKISNQYMIRQNVEALGTWIEGFLRDRRGRDLSPFTIEYYRAQLAAFETFARARNVIQTTQEYLNLNLDLESTASDFVPLAG